MRTLSRRLWLAFTTAPGPSGWALAAAALVAFAAIALPFGLSTGVLMLSTPEPWQRLVLFAAVAVAVPSLAEELVFRAALLPHPTEGASVRTTLIALTLSVALFVVWHPLNAALFLPAARPLFTDARFLALAALLGACCSAVYVRSGSVWPGVALHWAVVVAWKAGLGGRLVLFG